MRAEQEAFEGDQGFDEDEVIDADPLAAMRREKELKETSTDEVSGSAGRAERELMQIGDEITMGIAEALGGLARLETFARKHGAQRAIGRFVRGRLEDIPAELEKAATRLRAAVSPAKKPAKGSN